MGSEYPYAVDMFMPDGFAFPGALKIAQAAGDVSIVIHGTGTHLNADGSEVTATEVRDSYLVTVDQRSSHFVVDATGNIVQCISLNDGAGANCCAEVGYDTYWTPFLNKYGNLNRCTISIEHCSTIDNSVYTAIQLDQSFRLVKWLCATFNIPATRIKTHASIDPINRARCPGAYPIDSLVQFVKVGKMIPQGWNDTIVNGDARLLAPNGKYVRGAFREYILSRYWDATDVPLEQEVVRSPIENSNTPLGKGTRQVFTFSTLEMLTDQGNKIIRGYTGQERLWLEQKVTQLQQALNNVQFPPTLSTDLQSAAVIISKLQQDIAQHA